MTRRIPLGAPRTGSCRVPDGTRIYAVGDIHGRRDLLDRLLLNLSSDLSRRPIERAIIVFLGDYVDRGSDSAGVLERLIVAKKLFEDYEPIQVACLRGNHEIFLSAFLNGRLSFAEWEPYGGLPTLLSYGVVPPRDHHRSDRDLVARLREVMPEHHLTFLNALETSCSWGDYFFVHAGVRPGIALAEQSGDDLFWIRGEFLNYMGPHEKVIVHGHTPVKEPEVFPYRINVDTGAFVTGRLTTVVLEQDQITFL